MLVLTFGSCAVYMFAASGVRARVLGVDKLAAGVRLKSGHCLSDRGHHHQEGLAVRRRRRDIESPTEVVHNCLLRFDLA